MVTKEEYKRYQYQQSEEGRKVLQMLECLKSVYCKKLNIPEHVIKTGKLTPLVNGITGEIDRFIER